MWGVQSKDRTMTTVRRDYVSRFGRLHGHCCLVGLDTLPSYFLLPPTIWLLTAQLGTITRREPFPI